MCSIPPLRLLYSLRHEKRSRLDGEICNKGTRGDGQFSQQVVPKTQGNCMVQHDFYNGK